MDANGERRRFPRFEVDPMYSSVSVRPAESSSATDGDGLVRHGHLYDLSLGGARIELDEACSAGETLAVEIELPGCPKPIAATARVVRVFDELDDPGPRRVCVEFETFATGAREMLSRHLAQGWLRPAPAQDPEAAIPMTLATVLQSRRSRARAASA
ncbi:MAG: PilZ domain-containing protein [Planctomycetota bacterium]